MASDTHDLPHGPGAVPRTREPVLGGVFDLAADAMLLLDDRRRPVAANPAACTLFGRDEDALCALRFDDLLPPARRRAVPELWRAALGTGSHEDRVQLGRPDGTVREAEYRIAVRVALGRHLVVLKDVTARRHAEDVRAATLDAALDAVITTDASGEILDWNAAAEQMFGHSEREALGRPMAELIIPPRLREAHAQGVRRSLRGRGARSRRMEPPGLRADGTEFPTELTIARTEGDEPLFIGVIRDLTDQRRMTEALQESESRFRRLAEQATDIIYLVSTRPSLRFDYINPAVTRMLGITADDLYADPRALLDLMVPEDRGLLDDLGAWGREPRTLRWRRADGEIVWTEHRSVLVTDEDGRTVAVQGIARDITAQVRAEAERGRLAQIVASSSDAILAKTPDGVITTWNAGAETLYGWSASEAIGSHISLIVPSDRRREDERVLAALMNGDAVPQYETQRIARDGTLLDVEINQSPVRDEAGAVVGASVIARDLTEHKRMERQLRRYAELDMLTGLLNRPRLEAELARAMRGPATDDAHGAVVILDLDHFKLVNDAHGQAAGDDVLRAVAQTLVSRSRETDVLARIGVDAFAVLLPDTREANAVAIARTLTTAVSGCARDLPLTACAGVALLGAESLDNPEEIIVAAELALARAKAAGPGTVELSSGRRDSDIGWVRRLREALVHDRLVLYAQPILDLASGRTSQHELLVRMVDDDGGVIEPGAFLPAAERFGIVRDLDRWVIRQAIAIAGEGRTIEVNLSARSIGDPDLTAWLEGSLSASGVEPARLIFEITETAAIENLDEARGLVQRLRGLGCGVALDDFGTGFGSFRYLKHLPVSHVKIDMEFVVGLADSEADQRIVRSIVSIAKGSGMKTVAEGVEDGRCLDLLREYGVDYAQGFHVGRPAPL